MLQKYNHFREEEK